MCSLWERGISGTSGTSGTSGGALRCAVGRMVIVDVVRRILGWRAAACAAPRAGPWDSAVVCNDTDEPALRGLRVLGSCAGAPPPAEAAAYAKACACGAMGGTGGTWLLMSGAAGDALRVRGTPRRALVGKRAFPGLAWRTRATASSGNGGLVRAERGDRLSCGGGDPVMDRFGAAVLGRVRGGLRTGGGECRSYDMVIATLLVSSMSHDAARATPSECAWLDDAGVRHMALS